MNTDSLLESEITERGAVVDALESDDGSEDEDKGEEKGEDEDGVKESAVGDVASCDLDLHQIKEPIAARCDRDASHARREANLHLRRRRPLSRSARSQHRDH